MAAPSLFQMLLHRMADDILHDINDTAAQALSELPDNIMNQLVPLLLPVGLTTLSNALDVFMGEPFAGRVSVEGAIRGTWITLCNARWGVNAELVENPAQLYWQMHIQDCVNAVSNPFDLIPPNLCEQLGRVDMYCILHYLFQDFGVHVRSLTLHRGFCNPETTDLLEDSPLGFTGIRLANEAQEVCDIIRSHQVTLRQLEFSNVRVDRNFISHIHEALRTNDTLVHGLERFSVFDANIGITNQVQQDLRSFIRNGGSLTVLKLSHCRLESLQVARILRDVEEVGLNIELLDFSLNTLNGVASLWYWPMGNLATMPNLRTLILRNSGIQDRYEVQHLISKVAKKVPNVVLLDLIGNLAGDDLANFNVQDAMFQSDFPQNGEIWIREEDEA